MISKLQKLTMAAGVLSVACAVLMLAPLFFPQADGQRAVLHNYFAIPFWLALALVMILAAGNLLCLLVQKRGDGGCRALFALTAAGLAAAGVLTLCRGVAAPLLDIPYLSAPRTVQLEDVQFSYDNIGDSPDILLAGVDASGEEASFAISSAAYEEGRAFSSQAAEMPGGHMIAADVAYLPYTGTVVRMDLQVQEASQS